MVAHVQNDERVVVTLSDRTGRVMYRQTCHDGFIACAKATIAIASREELRAGDIFTLTVTAAANGEVHQEGARETD
jgi:hypothetical protein